MSSGFTETTSEGSGWQAYFGNPKPELLEEVMVVVVYPQAHLYPVSTPSRG